MVKADTPSSGKRDMSRMPISLSQLSCFMFIIIMFLLKNVIKICIYHIYYIYLQPNFKHWNYEYYNIITFKKKNYQS